MLGIEVIGALIALALGVLGHIKSLIAAVTSIVVKRVQCDHIIANRILAMSKRFGGVAPKYDAWNLLVRRRHRVEWVAGENPSQAGSIVLRVGRTLLHFHCRYEMNIGWVYVFSWIRGTLNWDELIVRAWEEAPKKQSGRHQVVRIGGSRRGDPASKNESNYGTMPEGARPITHTRDEIFAGIPSVEPIVLGAESREVLATARRWRDSEEWHRTRGLPWKLGVLLHGKPGTGKTMLLRKIARELDLPVYLVDLAGMDNEDLHAAFARARADSPSMLVVEDIDAIFRGRVHAAATAMDRTPVTFDALLQCVDGLEDASGLLFAVTTNDITVVDDALKDRPGRIDLCREVLPLGAQERAEVVRMIVRDPVREAVVLASLADDAPASKVSRAASDEALRAWHAHQPEDPTEEHARIRGDALARARVVRR